LKNGFTLIGLKKTLVVIFLVTALFGLFVWFLFSEILPIAGDFRNNLWGPSYQLIHGMSPYDISSILDGLNPVWLPVIIGIFFPLGFLPLQAASNLWFVITALSLFFLVIILARMHQRSLVFIFLATVSLALFPSSVAHIKLGQVSLLICLLLFLLILRLNQWKPLMLGAVLAITFTKPQLIVLFLPAFVIVLYREKGLKTVLKTIAFSFTWALVFCVPLFLIYPNWIPDFLNNLTTNPHWAYPTLYAWLLSSLESQSLAIALSGLYLLAGISIVVYLSLKHNGLDALMWSLSLTTLFSPLIWSWDFVLMYPLILYMAFDRRSKTSCWISIVGFLTGMVLFIIMKNAGFVNDRYAIWVPVLLNAILATSYLVKKKTPSLLTAPK
jgi:hypothetical protein